MARYKEDSILKMILDGYTAPEICKECNLPAYSYVYGVAYKHNLKVTKAKSNRHEEIKEYKAKGHTNKEVSEKFGLNYYYVKKICRGIAPQKSAFPNKGTLQDIENVIRIINERASCFEYAGNYTGSDGHVDLRCKKCGHIITARWSALRFNGRNSCPNCERIEREKRDAEEKRRREQQRIEEERKKRGQEAIRMLKRAKRLHRCPVCGTITDNKEYCSAKCYAKAHEATKDANRRKKIKNALIDKDISLDRLYNRDDGICGICGEKCDWSDHQYRGRYFIAGKNYPSIDHIIPLSKGGKHSWENVQLAHFSCNSAKGAKTCG